MAKINLPTAPRAAVLKTPKRMILFSKPKVGKTISVSRLPKCLILDFEEGTLAIDAMSYPIRNITDIDDVCEAIKEANYPYSFIAIDTASALEEMCIPMAEYRYSLSPEGKNWLLHDEHGNLHPKSGKYQYGTVMNLPFGKGYQYVAEIFGEVISKLEKCAPKIIILAHSTYATLNKDGAEFTSLDIQMSKKCKFVSTFKADAIGYIYRDKNKNYVNFTATDDVGAGGRHRYLEKEHILLSEFIEDEDSNEKLVTYWEKIFAPGKEKSKENN